MREEPLHDLDQYRLHTRPSPHPYASPAGASFGSFAIPLEGSRRLIVVSSGRPHEGDGGWEHVSVSLPNRCPTWEEMCRVKRLFWKDDECVVQFHPPEAANINVHNYCLHLWRWLGGEFPMPPTWAV